ncbi:MAG: PAS domain S-box protein, partial [Verrucomicrobiaceae bacterium]|nr:PAS domain S-box protein [Verrucomicrobiaceae bacterium]
DQWYMTRIAPYRTSEDRIVGVVATFVDISGRKKAEQELRLSEQRLKDALSISTVGVMFWRDEVLADVNDAFLRMSGFTREEAVGKTWQELTPEEFHEVSLRGLEELATRGESTPFEKQYFRKDRSRWWGLFAGRQLGEEMVEFVIDITDRKRAEEGLRQSEERFRTVADNVPQVIWTNDAEGKANYFNRRWYEYSGLSFEESAGPGWQAIVHPDDAPVSIERWQEAFAKGDVFDCEYRLRGADGGYRWFIGRNVPLRHNGDVLGWFGTATDIEGRKFTEAALRETEERFQLLVEGARDYAMFLLDPQNKITYWSRGAERVFGWTRDEVMGQSGDIIFTEEDKKKDAVEREINVALQNGACPDRRWHVRKGGAYLWVDGIMRRLDDDKGNVRGFAKIARDASDQRAIDDALRHSKDEMEQRVLERTRDLIAMNNELERTMSQRQQLEKELLEISEREKRRIGEDLHDMVCQELTATALFLKTTAKKLAIEAPPASQTLDEAAQIVNRNVGLTRDLARGLQPAELSGAGLKPALKALAEQACENTNIKCHFKAARGVRVTDEDIALHIYRVAQEAVKNAVKHAEAENILITLDRDKEHVCITIEDDGKGFTASRRSKGLGLHIMRYRANALGGELKIERRKHGGMEIRCKIPLKRG